MAGFLLRRESEQRLTVGEATVFCPHCEKEELCKHKEIVTKGGKSKQAEQLQSDSLQYYKCQSCQGHFPVKGGLDWKDVKNKSALPYTILTCMVYVRMAASNGQQVLDRNEARLIKQQYFNFAFVDLESSESVRERSQYTLKVSKLTLSQDLMPRVVQQLTEKNKDWIFKAMAAVCQQANHPNPQEAQVMQQVGQLLGLSQRQTQEYILLHNPNNNLRSHMNRMESDQMKQLIMGQCLGMTSDQINDTTTRPSSNSTFSTKKYKNIKNSINYKPTKTC